MIRGIDRLAKDMTVKMLRQEKVTGNIANASTSGYKGERVFLSVLKGQQDGARPLKEAQQQATSFTDFSQGPVDYTQRKLDAALDGEGFFVVETPNGERFTRSGNFTLNPQGLLTTQSGDLVQGTQGPIPILGENVSIAVDGTVLVNNAEVGRLKVVAFDDPQTLAREGGMFAQTTGAYAEVDFSRTRVIQGALERSNVNPIDQLVDMIALNRGFEADQKGVLMQDDATRRLLESASQAPAK
jgi:flagellar basal-body rod protein FlgG